MWDPILLYDCGVNSPKGEAGGAATCEIPMLPQKSTAGTVDLSLAFSVFPNEEKAQITWGRRMYVSRFCEGGKERFEFRVEAENCAISESRASRLRIFSCRGGVEEVIF